MVFLCIGLGGQVISNTEIERRAQIVANEFGGVLPPMEAFYLHSIIYSASRSYEAFLRYDVGLASQSGAPYIVSSVHEALSHAAALSRFFWPSQMGGKKNATFRKLREKRAEYLRNAFGLNENSSLKKRALRDALEHFDERLDRYLLVNDTGYFFPAPLIEDYSLADDPAGNIFKLVDPVNSYFVLLGEKFNFEPIRNEVEAIMDKANQKDQQGGRLA